jgi:hypothetical protein
MTRSPVKISEETMFADLPIEEWKKASSIYTVQKAVFMFDSSHAAWNLPYMANSVSIALFFVDFYSLSMSASPVYTVGPYKDRFLPLRECSEHPQLLLYFSAVFFSERQYPWPSSHDNFF